MARASAKTSKIEEKIEETLGGSADGDLQAQVEQLKKDIASIAGTLADLGSQKVRAARKNARQTYRSARLQGQDVVDDLRGKAEDFEEQICATVRERPLTSLATAVGVGYLLALFTRR